MNITSFLKSNIALVVFAAIGCFLFAAVLVVIGTSNNYNGLVVKAEAVQLDNTNRLDNMRKKVREVAGVSQQEVAALKASQQEVAALNCKVAKLEAAMAAMAARMEAMAAQVQELQDEQHSV